MFYIIKIAFLMTIGVISSDLPETCPPGSQGIYPYCECYPPYTGTPPYCFESTYAQTSYQEQICPPGFSGLFPNCILDACPPMQSGRPPHCTPFDSQECPVGLTGTPPDDCYTPCPSNTSGRPPNCERNKCPTGWFGTYEPYCTERPPCPSDRPNGQWPFCSAGPCPVGTVGVVPNCIIVVPSTELEPPDIAKDEPRPIYVQPAMLGYLPPSTVPPNALGYLPPTTPDPVYLPPMFK